MNDDTYRSQFRLPYALYEQLKASADRNRRSVNAELVARLEITIGLDEHMATLTLGEENSGHTLSYLKWLADRGWELNVLDTATPNGLSEMEKRLENVINQAFDRIQSQLPKPTPKK